MAYSAPTPWRSRSGASARRSATDSIASIRESSGRSGPMPAASIVASSVPAMK